MPFLTFLDTVVIIIITSSSSYSSFNLYILLLIHLSCFHHHQPFYLSISSSLPSPPPSSSPSITTTFTSSILIKHLFCRLSLQLLQNYSATSLLPPFLTFTHQHYRTFSHFLHLSLYDYNSHLLQSYTTPTFFSTLLL